MFVRLNVPNSIPEVTRDRLLIKRQIRPLFCRHDCGNFLAKCISKLNETVWAKSRYINDSQLTEMKSLEYLEIDESVLGRIGAHLDAPVAYAPDHVVYNIAKEPFHLREFWQSFVEHSHVEGSGEVNRIQKLHQRGSDFVARLGAVFC